MYESLINDPRLGDIRQELATAHGETLWSLATRNLRWASRTHAIRAALGSMRRGKYKSALLIPAAFMPRRLLTRHDSARP